MRAGAVSPWAAPPASAAPSDYHPGRRGPGSCQAAPDRTIVAGYPGRVPKAPKMLSVEARPFSALVQEMPLPWPTPMRELMKNPDGGDYVWRRLTYVFRLNNPRELAPTRPTLTANERELVQRFVEQARSLAGTTLLGASDRVTVNVPDFEGEATVVTELSDPDVTVGFMVLLRQCYANDDEASFARVRKSSNSGSTRLATRHRSTS